MGKKEIFIEDEDMLTMDEMDAFYGEEVEDFYGEDPGGVDIDALIDDLA